ncbi:MAG: restriction endonuclease [Proteobacteria bacterium]|nr:restriction endonuclease [Pseudomonadota bacterium]MBU1715904.1 restriction endonuclease [Pseudomonadota bacterium]
MNIDLLKGLDLVKFERLCKTFFDQMGFQTHKSGSGGGVNVSEVNVLHSKSTNAPFSFFQCSVNELVNVDVLATFKNAMDSLNLKNGYFLSVEGFEAAARNFVAGKGVNLIDGLKFIEMVGKLPKPGQDLLKEMAMVRQDAGEKEERKTAPHACPKCGVNMLLRVSEEGKYKTGKFWQCPDCAHIIAF